MSVKRKKDSDQPELPIEGAIPAPAGKKSAKKSAANGNGATHVLAEEVPAAIAHIPFDPRKSDAGLHRRVDRGFLEYASYVIRDRAIPNLADGLKPVQRRILWALHQNDDGRFIKVANVVGDTMKFHPHGDASIGDALVVLANKRYLIEGQGNFGNVFTGDPAAAPATSNAASRNWRAPSCSTTRSRNLSRVTTAATGSRSPCPAGCRSR